MFDVSHMTVLDLHGPRTREFLRYLLANNVDKLKVTGKALYSCMLNDEGGVIEDLIVYLFDEPHFRLVGNAGKRAKDLAWLDSEAKPVGGEVREGAGLSSIRVPGPHDATTVLE